MIVMGGHRLSRGITDVRDQVEIVLLPVTDQVHLCNIINTQHPRLFEPRSRCYSPCLHKFVQSSGFLQLRRLHPRNRPARNFRKVESYYGEPLLAKYRVLPSERGSSWGKEPSLHGRGLYFKDDEIRCAFGVGESVCIFGRDLLHGRY